MKEQSLDQLDSLNNPLQSKLFYVFLKVINNLSSLKAINLKISNDLKFNIFKEQKNWTS